MVNNKQYTHFEAGKPITADTDHIKIEGHIGKWYVIDERIYYGEKVFLLEHETYGDEAACLIVNETGKIILDDVYDGFDDLEE